jgi:antitoxin component of RelBE/YafQ-DinJ toxin-antitoxin module
MDDEAILVLRMPRELKEKFFQQTKEEDLTSSQVVRHLIKKWLAEKVAG